jgi:glycosyltransferase involved in cell wall biosynthesis
MSDKRPLRVLQIVGTLGMGGAETWLMELLKYWQGTGAVQMDFLLTSGKCGIFDDNARKLGAHLHYVRYGRSDLRSFMGEFRRILRDGHYDVIHDHNDYVAGWRFVMGLGVLPQVRITHVHNPWLHIDTNYAVTPFRKLSTIVGKTLVNLLATQICGTSGDILRQYDFEPGRLQRPPVAVVHCGIDVGLFNRPRDGDRAAVLHEFEWPNDAKVVLFAGRLDRALEFDHPQNHKNSWFALNVARAALETEPRLRLLMAGAGEQERQELERRIAAWGMRDKLNLIGIRRDIPRLMRAADALFFPSRQEGLGMVAVEAQATGLPVLASTAVPREAIVIPELVQSLPLSEPVDRWAEVLLDMMSAPRKPAEVYRRAMEASNFAIANSAGNLLRVYTGTGGSEGFDT